MSAVVSYLTARQWAMDPKALRAAADAIAVALEKIPPETLRAAQERSPRADARGPGGTFRPYELRDGIAHIPITGVILKEVPCVFELLDMPATSTVAAQAAIDAALNDSAVRAISLDIDSPGGSMAGVQELADTVFAVRGLKPITAQVSDMCASAAYWIASQADSIAANETATVGSIGVYSVMDDSSAAAAAAGVMVHVIRSHPLKGAGVPGSVVTDDQLADGQRIIDQAADLFIAAVARGRGLDAATVRGVATGQIWFAGQARDLGLIDTISSPASAAAGSVAGLRADSAPQPDGKCPTCGCCDACPCGCTAGECSCSSSCSCGCGGRMSAGASAASTCNQALRAEEERKMSDKLQAENDLLKAKLAAMEENQKAITHREKLALLDKYADRFMPAARAAFENLAGHMDHAALEAHLQALPRVTRPAIEVPVVKEAQRAVAEGVASISATDPRTGRNVGGRAGAEQVARLIGTSVERIDRYSKVIGWRSNGTFELEDGRIVTREELESVLAH